MYTPALTPCNKIKNIVIQLAKDSEVLESGFEMQVSGLSRETEPIGWMHMWRERFI